MYTVEVMAKKLRGAPVQDWFDEEERREPGFIASLDEANLRSGIAADVKALREAAELTQAELAAKVGTLQPGIARLESGKALPDLATLHKIAQALGYRVRVSFEPIKRRPPRRAPRG